MFHAEPQDFQSKFRFWMNDMPPDNRKPGISGGFAFVVTRFIKRFWKSPVNGQRYQGENPLAPFEEGGTYRSPHWNVGADSEFSSYAKLS